jgi:hypothetical protein
VALVAARWTLVFLERIEATDGLRTVRMARTVSYVSAAKLVSMVRGNQCLSIIDVRYARAASCEMLL